MICLYSWDALSVIEQVNAFNMAPRAFNMAPTLPRSEESSKTIYRTNINNENQRMTMCSIVKWYKSLVMLRWLYKKIHYQICNINIENKIYSVQVCKWQHCSSVKIWLNPTQTMCILCCTAVVIQQGPATTMFVSMFTCVLFVKLCFVFSNVRAIEYMKKILQLCKQ